MDLTVLTTLLMGLHKRVLTRFSSNQNQVMFRDFASNAEIHSDHDAICKFLEHVLPKQNNSHHRTSTITPFGHLVYYKVTETCKLALKEKQLQRKTLRIVLLFVVCQLEKRRKRLS